MDSPDYYDHPDDRHLFQPSSSLPHSGVGIASLVIALISGLGVFLLIVVAAIMESRDPGIMLDDHAPPVMLLVLGVLGCGFGSVVGMILGIVGLSQSNRKNTFAVVGMVFNALVLLGLALLCVVGLGFSDF